MLEEMDEEPSFDAEISRSPTPVSPEEAAEPVDDEDVESSEPVPQEGDENAEASSAVDSAPRIRDSHH